MADPFPWRTYADEHGVTVVQLIASFARTWSYKDQWARPCRTRDLDRLATDDPARLRTEIDLLATKGTV